MTISDFHTQDALVQAARLDVLARQALNAYGLADATFTLAAYTNNAVYRADAGDQYYALRIHRPGHRQLAWIESELQWLKFLSHETPLIVPHPVNDIYTGTLEGVERPVYCVLFDWIEGETGAARELTLGEIRAVGGFCDLLHHYSAKFIPAGDFERPRRDWVGLFGNESDYAHDSFNDEQQAIITETSQQVREVMNSLDNQPNNFGLIHADLIAKNLFFQEGQVGAIDFDDCGYGYFLYDLAPLLWFARTEPGYADLRKALWEGYTAVRPQPESHFALLETFVAARHVASCRWIIGNQEHPAIRGHVPEIIATRIDELRHFLKYGVMQTDANHI